MNSYDNKVNTKINKPPLSIQFNHNSHSYNIYTANKRSVSTIKNFSPQSEALINITRMFENVKFNGLSTLIDYCKAEKIHSLHIVLEWISYMIYKEDKNVYNKLELDNHLIIGVNNFLTLLTNEKEEQSITNGIKYYTSDTRNLIVNLLLDVMNETNFMNSGHDFDSLISRFTFNLFTLNFHEGNKIIKEIFTIKDNKKIPNEMVPFLLIFQEVLQHFEQSQISSYQNLNNTVKNLMTTFDKIELSSNLKFIILFIQQKFNTKYQEFLHSRDISIILKLIFILKFDSKEDMLIHLQELEKFYVDFGLLEGLILTGTTKGSIGILESYINLTDDILLCYLLSKFFVDNKETFYKKCEYELFDVLNHLKLFNERIQIEQKLNEILSHTNKKGSSKIHITRKHTNSLELMLTCFYCNSKINPEKTDHPGLNSRENVESIDFCPKCIKKFPSCAICLCPIVLEVNVHNSKHKLSPNLSASELKRERLSLSSEFEEKSIDLKYLWCTKCRHGGHVDHIYEWFQELMICPVADCNCVCLEYNHIMN